jgi:hypothetical protein
MTDVSKRCNSKYVVVSAITCRISPPIRGEVFRRGTLTPYCTQAETPNAAEGQVALSRVLEVLSGR